MLKKQITYENPFTDQKVTEEFYFHISKAEMVRMEVEEHKEVYTDKDGETHSGMRAKLHRIVEAEDGKAMMPMFEDIIRRSYGRKDGDRFIQTNEIWQDFKGSGAFDELLFELCTDADAAADFINATMPRNLDAVAAEVAARAAKPAAKKRAPKKDTEQGQLGSEDRTKLIASASVDNPVVLTQDEMVTMESSDLQTGLASGKFRLS